MTMRVLILGAGATSGSEEPHVLLAEQNRELLVEHFARMLGHLGAAIAFVIKAEDQRRFHVGDVIALASPGAALVQVAGETAGAACTALLAIDHIDPNDELLILASNELLDIDYGTTIEGFRARGLDAATVVFPSLHPRYSYVALDDAGNIVEAAEKRPISRLATAGFYWYRRGADFIAAVQDLIRKDAHIDGRFYISLTFNELVLRQRKLGVCEVRASQYNPLKSRRQISLYESQTSAEATP